jgi:hypothetical protein
MVPTYYSIQLEMISAYATVNPASCVAYCSTMKAHTLLGSEFFFFPCNVTNCMCAVLLCVLLVGFLFYVLGISAIGGLAFMLLSMPLGKWTATKTQVNNCIQSHTYI